MMAKAYIIMTEAGASYDATTLAEATSHFPCGFTFWRGGGFWESIKEDNITILVTGVSMAQVRALVSSIKRKNKQSCVLVLAVDAEVLFI